MTNQTDPIDTILADISMPDELFDALQADSVTEENLTQQADHDLEVYKLFMEFADEMEGKDSDSQL